MDALGKVFQARPREGAADLPERVGVGSPIASGCGCSQRGDGLGAQAELLGKIVEKAVKAFGRRAQSPLPEPLLRCRFGLVHFIAQREPLQANRIATGQHQRRRQPFQQLPNCRGWGRRAALNQQSRGQQSSFARP